jgi:spore coat protein U-like protein
VATRKLTNGSTTINYSLYTASNHSTVWGNTVSTDTVSATGNGAPQSYTVYGRIPAQTTPAPNAYSDTITVTVTY